MGSNQGTSLRQASRHTPADIHNGNTDITRAKQDDAKLSSTYSETARSEFPGHETAAPETEQNELQPCSASATEFACAQGRGRQTRRTVQLLRNPAGHVTIHTAGYSGKQNHMTVNSHRSDLTKIPGNQRAGTQRGIRARLFYFSCAARQLTVASNEFTVRPTPPSQGSKPAWMLVRYHWSVTGCSKSEVRV